MEWNNTETFPETLIQIRYYYRRPYAVITVVVYNEETKSYKYKDLDLPVVLFDYDTIVNAIINTEYPSDKMLAVINNYLLDNLNLLTNKEFEDMQKFRKFAKDYAHRLLEYDNEHKIWPLH